MTHDTDVLNLFVQRGHAAQEAANDAVNGKSRRGVAATPLLCRDHVRQFLLDAARQHRPFNKFKRVSEDTLVAANAALRQWCVARVKAMPSKGQTL